MFLFSRSEWPSMPVLGPIADAYVSYLQHGGYGLTTMAVYCNSVSHRAHWMNAEQLSLVHLEEQLVRRFVAEHLPHCHCSSPRQNTVSTVRAALLHLLRLLRAQDLLGPRLPPGPPSVQRELQRFLRHLEQVGGLAPATRLSRQRWVSQFLLDRFGPASIQMEQISPRDLVDFLLRQKERYKPGTAGVIGCALRRYLRLRALQDGDRVETLIAAVPTVAHWRLAALPTPLTPEEISRVLNAFDLHTAHGQRGYAMTRCLADLGLRAQDCEHRKSRLCNSMTSTGRRARF